ncbi:MAG TPA: phosphate ABC transporter ATP-binding protein [Cyanobacteria bacterium UBA11149]|nr:phosphate ABC transporter ATP-binding protein [Cyanobacteria bacterium UBA11367]HBE60688.1 phosphate ABC transporter ATP-binding protein [Cyanobacteria bacterium UBA11366]HBK63898.1 phosphate ABC transporter ATP-binding protein [Cyanobacteria bacterium UBA11166]HBR72991.1 phosphate ABC transporter ATP-binding protein [Cyanobacteria bacterium UBA11159]HBS69436.1 phosphate ABC transporter ATP-binding protein [Cyanobacteria bacterium UBA11153]HBW91953.1 phosphate ABC transporter ATP-binding pr
MKTPLIETQNLSLYYKNKPAFSDINLSIFPHTITALIGPSGCGKTSFLTCLNRLTDLIPKTRISGKILLGDIDVLDSKTNAIAIRRRIGTIFQKPNPFPFSIWQNLAFPLREHGIKNREEIDRIIESTLQDVGLWDEVKNRLKTSALSLSGGQQQRLCIARALVLQPEVLLLDEPCSALDPISSGVVEDLIASLRERYTLVIVTHNLAQAKRIADSVALFWVKDGVGKLIEYGDVKQIFTAPQESLTAAYINGDRG